MTTEQILKFCRVCRGNSIVVTGRFRCASCGLSKQDYIKDGQESVIEEMEYLHNTWLKVKKFRQITTGYKKLDYVITRMFGVPHGRYWRDYDRLTPEQKAKFVDSEFLILRTLCV